MAPFELSEFTFTISTTTDMLFFRHQIAQYFEAIEEKNWAIFDDNGDKIDVNENLR